MTYPPELTLLLLLLHRDLKLARSPREITDRLCLAQSALPDTPAIRQQLSILRRTHYARLGLR